jgi:hypothetical protein
MWHLRYFTQGGATPHTAKETIRALRDVFGEFNVANRIIIMDFIFVGCMGVWPGLENRDYGRRGSAALTMRRPSIRKS